MFGLYTIINCPKCGTEIPIEYGYTCGFDTIIEIEDAICRNKDCREHFEIDLDLISKSKCVEVDWDDFKPTDNDLVEIDSYRTIFLQI